MSHPNVVSRKHLSRRERRRHPTSESDVYFGGPIGGPIMSAAGRLFAARDRVELELAMLAAGAPVLFVQRLRREGLAPHDFRHPLAQAIVLACDCSVELLHKSRRRVPRETMAATVSAYLADRPFDLPEQPAVVRSWFASRLPPSWVEREGRRWIAALRSIDAEVERARELYRQALDALDGWSGADFATRVLEAERLAMPRVA